MTRRTDADRDADRVAWNDALMSGDADRIDRTRDAVLRAIHADIVADDGYVARTTDDRYTVRRTRVDGSVTFHGSRVTLARATRERDAWLDADRERVSASDPRDRLDPLTRHVVVVPWSDARAEMRAWRRATRDGSRYYPDVDR